ncbi:MAG: isochorismate synthase [Actinobacteria bacterium]|nr:isochorismate synthase [Actinomycetota bacterium]
MAKPSLSSIAAVDAAEAAIRRAAERDGRTLASATVLIDPLDVGGSVLASRLASDRWFCWEQPERDGFALGALGAVREVVSRGEDRFGEVAADCAELLGDAAIEAPPGLPAGAGAVWTGGFAFSPDGGRTPEWSSLPPALMVMPELSLLRQGAECWLTVNALVAGPEDAEPAIARVRRRLEGMREGSPGPLDPDPTGSSEIGAPRPPDDYERIVSAGVERIEAGDLEKVVLAREVTVSAPAAHEPGAVLGALRELFPSCFCFCVGSPEAAFIGASPELLIRRRGAVAATVALAGSTRRSADPSVDDHLGEQMLHSPKVREEHEIVARRIARSLRPISVWVRDEEEPSVVRIANVQHLATPIQGQLADSRSAVELAGLLHPTPAVGGEPRERAIALIDELEGLDRGWYAGPVGWMDAAEDGEFCVALRSGLLRDRTAHLFAGCGIVAGSDPASELAETEIKLEALLPLLAG